MKTSNCKLVKLGAFCLAFLFYIFKCTSPELLYFRNGVVLVLFGLCEVRLHDLNTCLDVTQINIHFVPEVEEFIKDMDVKVYIPGVLLETCFGDLETSLEAF